MAKQPHTDLQSKPSPDQAIRVVVYIERGCVQWTACDDQRVQVEILDADTQDDDRAAAYWQEATIPMSEITSELLAVIEHTMISEQE